MFLFAWAAPRLSLGASEGPRIVAKQYKDIKIQYHTPLIPYPFQAIRSHLIGQGTIEVSFNEQGTGTKAVMTKSTGSSVLDDAATRYAKAYWKSSAGNPSTLEVHVVFTLSPLKTPLSRTAKVQG